MTQRDDDDAQPECGSPAAAEHAGHVDCRRVADLLGDYVDEQLPSSLKVAVESHMSQCAPCIAFLRQYKFAPEAARRMLLKQVPEELEQRLLSFLKSKCK